MLFFVVPKDKGVLYQHSLEKEKLDILLFSLYTIEGNFTWPIRLAQDGANPDSISFCIYFLTIQQVCSVTLQAHNNIAFLENIKHCTGLLAVASKTPGHLGEKPGEGGDWKGEGPKSSIML